MGLAMQQIIKNKQNHHQQNPKQPTTPNPVLKLRSWKFSGDFLWLESWFKKMKQEI